MTTTPPPTTARRPGFHPFPNLANTQSQSPPEPPVGTVLAWQTSSGDPSVAVRSAAGWTVDGDAGEYAWGSLLHTISGPDKWTTVGVAQTWAPLIPLRPRTRGADPQGPIEGCRRVTGDGIDLDVLLAVSARHQGLDPDQLSPVMGPVVANLVTEIGPLIVHPLTSGDDLRWLAAGLDALARAAEIAAHATDPPDEPSASQLWRYDLRGDRVQVTGVLRAAEFNTATIGVPTGELKNLVALLAQVRQDPAFKAWADRNQDEHRIWQAQTRHGIVCAHTPNDACREFPSPGRWRLRGSITLYSRDVVNLYTALVDQLDQHSRAGDA